MWCKNYGLLLVFLVIGSSYGKAVQSSDAVEAESARVSDSVSHILRSLTLPEEEKVSPVQIITKHGILEAKPGTARVSRKLFFGDTSGLDTKPGVPAPVVVSSQAIKITGPNDTNGRQKRGRSLSTVDADGVRTIEGVRVPDDEHDKYHTYRNARVIKNFLVENNRPANPHKKRQIIVQDASQYLAAAAAAAANGATVIDASTLTQQPQAQSYYIAQPAAAAAPAQTAQVVYSATAAPQIFAATAAPQVFTATPAAAAYAGASAIAALTGGAQQQQQQQGQMYVLQPDGKTYLPYNPQQGQAQLQQAYAAAAAEQQPQPEKAAPAPTQYASRTGEAEHHQHHHQQELRQENEYQHRILSLHRSKESHIEIHPHSGQVPIDHRTSAAAASPVEYHQIARVAATAIPTGATIRQQLQEQVSAQSARVQFQHPEAPVVPHHVNFHAHHQQLEHAFSTAAPPTQMSHGFPVSSNHFVIKPQTYMAGGGQVFQVPVPIPVEQVGSIDRRDHNNHHSGEEEDSKHRKAPPTKETLTNRVMQALNLGVNRRTAERIETSAIVPVLSSAGIIMGLGAIAAGWYLSQNNREVGILKRTGKPAAAAAAGTKDKAIIEHLRSRRSAGGEVDQASFFQSIIQQGIEKQQQQFETSAEPTEAAYVERRPSYSTKSKSKIAAAVREDRDRLAEEKHGHGHKKGNRLSKIKNFANVAIPSVVLGGSVLVIAGLIVYWYFTGKNREIAFLEPSAYSRRKRDLTPVTGSSSTDNLILDAVHSFDGQPRSTSSDVTNNSREVAWADKGHYTFGHFPTKYHGTFHRVHKRAINAATENIMWTDSVPEKKASFFQQLLGDLEFSPSSLLTKLQENDYAKWQETPCALRVFCETMTTQSDDTVRLMEKRITKFLFMLPESMSESLSRSLGGVMMAIQKGDCSAYTCSNNFINAILPSNALPR